jgi:hypothetical protein
MLTDIVGQQLNSCQQLNLIHQHSTAYKNYGDEQSTDWLLKKQSGVKKYLVLGREYERMKGNRREFFPSPEQSRTPSCII